MTYLKCATCKVRLYSVASADNPIRDLCPGCGEALEPVGELSDVVGYRSMKLRGELAESEVARGVLIEGFAEARTRSRAKSAGSFDGLAAGSAAVTAAPRMWAYCNSPGDTPWP